MICDGCTRELDIKIEAHCLCSTHSKNYCWDCGEKHICVPKERCARLFITNPAWVCRLIETIEKKNDLEVIP